MRVGRLLTSKARMGPMPPLPDCRLSQNGAVPMPMGVTNPRPVTTTLRGEPDISQLAATDHVAWASTRRHDDKVKIAVYFTLPSGHFVIVSRLVLSSYQDASFFFVATTFAKPSICLSSPLKTKL